MEQAKLEVNVKVQNKAAGRRLAKLAYLAQKDFQDGLTISEAVQFGDLLKAVQYDLTFESDDLNEVVENTPIRYLKVT